MFQTMLVTGLTPLSAIKNEIDHWENMPFTTVWPDSQQNPKEPEITKTIKKKKKRVRTAFTTDQIRALERTFTKFKYLDSERRRELAATLNISDKTIKVWFQNRRMKEKRESSESSCDSSSEILNVTPQPPNHRPMVDQVDSTSFYHGNVQELLTINTPTVDSSNQQPYDQSYQYQPTVYQNHAYQLPRLTSSEFVYDLNVYPTQYYPYPTNGNYSGHYQNADQYNQRYNEQDYENCLHNFDSVYY